MVIFRNSEVNITLIESTTSGIKKFTTKGLSEAFNSINKKLSEIESMDQNTEKIENVCHRI